MKVHIYIERFEITSANFVNDFDRFLKDKIEGLNRAYWHMKTEVIANYLVVILEVSK